MGECVGGGISSCASADYLLYNYYLCIVIHFLFIISPSAHRILFRILEIHQNPSERPHRRHAQKVQSPVSRGAATAGGSCQVQAPIHHLL